MSATIVAPKTGRVDSTSRPQGYEDLDLPSDKRELLLYHESKKELEKLRFNTQMHKGSFGNYTNLGKKSFLQ